MAAPLVVTLLGDLARLQLSSVLVLPFISLSITAARIPQNNFTTALLKPQSKSWAENLLPAAQF